MLADSISLCQSVYDDACKIAQASIRKHGYELRGTAFKINLVDPGYAATDFNHHSGPGTVEDAATLRTYIGGRKN